MGRVALNFDQSEGKEGKFAIGQLGTGESQSARRTLASGRNLATPVTGTIEW